MHGFVPPNADESCTFKVNALIECLTAIIIREYQSNFSGQRIHLSQPLNYIAAPTVHYIK